MLDQVPHWKIRRKIGLIWQISLDITLRRFGIFFFLIDSALRHVAKIVHRLHCRQFTYFIMSKALSHVPTPFPPASTF